MEQACRDLASGRSASCDSLDVSSRLKVRCRAPAGRQLPPMVCEYTWKGKAGYIAAFVLHLYRLRPYSSMVQVPRQYDHGGSVRRSSGAYATYSCDHRSVRGTKK